MKKKLTDTDRLNWLELRNDAMVVTDYETGLVGISEWKGNVNDRYVVELSTGCIGLRDAIDFAIRTTK